MQKNSIAISKSQSFAELNVTRALLGVGSGENSRTINYIIYLCGLNNIQRERLFHYALLDMYEGFELHDRLVIENHINKLERRRRKVPSEQLIYRIHGL